MLVYNLNIKRKKLIALEEITAQFNLSKSTQKIFTIALMKGCVSPSTIASILGYELKTVKKGLKDLENKQLVKQISGITPRYIPLPPIKGFIDYINEYSDEINGIIKTIKKIDESKSDSYDNASQYLISDINKRFDGLTEELLGKKEAITRGLNEAYDKTEKVINSSNKTALDE